MNVANSLTLFRIVLVPVFIVSYLSSFGGHEFVALAVFLMASLTDTVDGFLARRNNKITTLGELLDPIADKLLITSAIICLVQSRAVAAWMAIVIIGREIAVTGLRAIAASQNVIIPASWPGKIKMTLETVTLSFLILGKGILGRLSIVGVIGLWLVLAAAVYSAGGYFIKYGPQLLVERSKQ